MLTESESVEVKSDNKTYVYHKIRGSNSFTAQ